MKQLWAPWRMPFIESDKVAAGCVLCNKATDDRDEENHVVYRSRHCFAMLNLYPYNSGHLMIVPYEHVARLDELPGDISAALMHDAQLSTRVLEKAMNPEGFNIGFNQGEAAGAGIADHIHLHVVPRWNGDTNFMPVLADTKVIPDLLLRTATKLRPIFAELAPNE